MCASCENEGNGVTLLNGKCYCDFVWTVATDLWHTVISTTENFELDSNVTGMSYDLFLTLGEWDMLETIFDVNSLQNVFSSSGSSVFFVSYNTLIFLRNLLVELQVSHFITTPSSSLIQILEKQF